MGLSAAVKVWILSYGLHVD